MTDINKNSGLSINDDHAVDHGLGCGNEPEINKTNKQPDRKEQDVIRGASPGAQEIELDHRYCGQHESDKHDNVFNRGVKRIPSIERSSGIEKTSVETIQSFASKPQVVRSREAVGTFYSHLKEAVVINRQRRLVYAKATNNRSYPLSTQLILSELMLLPLAKYFDWQGREFNVQGIPIITDDFVSMQSIKEVGESPLLQNGPDVQRTFQLKQAVQNYVRQIKPLLAEHEFYEICQYTEQCITQIETIERNMGVHYAMLIHLLESIGLAAVNAIGYASLSAGRTQGLSRRLITIQMYALKGAIRVDIAAQKIHAMGAGIIVNDVPKIPFLRRWHKVKSLQAFGMQCQAVS